MNKMIDYDLNEYPFAFHGTRYPDKRGYFEESYNKNDYNDELYLQNQIDDVSEIVNYNNYTIYMKNNYNEYDKLVINPPKAYAITNDFVQDNIVYSKKNVWRGFHFQVDNVQAKLLRVIKGAIIDVIIDIRPESEQFGYVRWYYLTEENNTVLYVPKGFAHGYLTLKKHNYVSYKVDNFRDAESEMSINYKDILTPDLIQEINYKCSLIKKMIKLKKIIVSDKDKNAISWKEYENNVYDSFK